MISMYFIPNNHLQSKFNNSTNTNKTTFHFKQLNTKKTMTYVGGNPGPGVNNLQIIYLQNKSFPPLGIGDLI
jgi:hypothetical protein